MLSLRDLSVSRGNKLLLDQVTVTLFEKQKIGLVGQNGCGKSTLFSLILGQLISDTGTLQLKNKIQISHLSQELIQSDLPALDFVLSGDEQHYALTQALQSAEIAQDEVEILRCHEVLLQTQGYAKPALAGKIMAGLGFKPSDQAQIVNSFSGGWRMRLNLARCLMNPADLLLLDEPTNHLDMEAIFWLEKWLKQSEKSIITISHDRDFLDAFVTHIWHIEQQKLISYTGNYTHFEQERATQLALQQKTYEKQQQKIAHLMSFVNRFRAKATKAKQAQSRLKMIEKMDTIAQAQADSPFSFEFFPAISASNPLIRCENIQAGYTQTQAVLKNINFNINCGDRIALLGPNGEGKSTFIKTLTKFIMPLAGEIHYSAHLKIAYYAQHQLDDLNPALSPIETIQALSPEAREQNIRNFLGGFNFVGDMAKNCIEHFSGGEKARLALAKLVWLKPNLLLLDEPTNHLDLNMRAAIELALQSYEGAMILISHDRHLLQSAVDEFYLVFQQHIRPFKGDLADYYQWLQQPQLSKEQPHKIISEHISTIRTNISKEELNHSNASSPSRAALPSSQREGKGKQNPRGRQEKFYKNRLQKLESQSELLTQNLENIEYQLADINLYKDHNPHLKTLLEEQKTLKDKLQLVEKEWLDVLKLLES